MLLVQLRPTKNNWTPTDLHYSQDEQVFPVHSVWNLTWTCARDCGIESRAGSESINVAELCWTLCKWEAKNAGRQPIAGGPKICHVHLQSVSWKNTNNQNQKLILTKYQVFLQIMTNWDGRFILVVCYKNTTFSKFTTLMSLISHLQNVRKARLKITKSLHLLVHHNN